MAGELRRRVPFHFFPIRQFLDRLLISSLYEVAVSFRHRRVRVADDLSDDVQVDPRIDHMSDEGMPEIVEAEIPDARPAARILERCPHIVEMFPVLSGEEEIAIRTFRDLR